MLLIAARIVLGVMLAAPFCAVARWLGRDRSIFAGTLIVLAVYYLVELTAAGAARAVLIELAGLVIFSAIGIVGWLGRYRLLAAGWVLHVVWDVVLHTDGRGAYVADWYPVRCIGFALFELARIRRNPSTAWAGDALTRNF